jgi:hypothetical protein
MEWACAEQSLPRGAAVAKVVRDEMNAKRAVKETMVMKACIGTG